MEASGFICVNTRLVDLSLLSFSAVVAGEEIGSLSGVAALRSALFVVYSSFLRVGFCKFSPPPVGSFLGRLFLVWAHLSVSLVIL